MSDRKQNGGARPGAGRKPADGSQGPFVRTNINLRADQSAALKSLGGSAWIRAQIDACTAILK